MASSGVGKGRLCFRTRGYQRIRTITSGPGLGPTQTVAKLAVRVVNEPKPSTWVLLNCQHPTCLNLAGCQQVTKQVHLSIELRLFLLVYVNSNLSKSCFQQPRICFCMLCSFQYR